MDDFDTTFGRGRLQNTPDSEPVFVIKASDPGAATAIRLWARQQHRIGDTTMAQAANDFANIVDNFSEPVAEERIED